MKRFLSKKGVTLAELVIVLGVLAIVSTMVTTFCILINGYHDLNQRRAEVVEQLANAEQLVTDFLTAYDSTNYTFACEEKRIVVTEKSSGSTKVLQISDKQITANLPSGQRTQTTSALNGVSLTRQKSGNNYLVLCTLTFIEPKLKETETVSTHTFAVFPKLLKAT